MRMKWPASLPEAARAMFRMHVDMLAELDEQDRRLDKEIARRAREDEVCAPADDHPRHRPDHRTAIAALARRRDLPKGRDFAAWLGPRRRCKNRPAASRSSGRISKMGERTLTAPAHHRHQRGRASGDKTRRAGGLVAGADAGAQATDAGDGRARQQDGAHRLGAADRQRGLQSSGRSRGVSLQRAT